MSTAPTPAHELTERALAAASGPLQVLVTETTGVNARWAANTLTTNGVVTGRSVTVLATREVEGGTAVGVVSRRGVGAADLADLVAQAESAAAASPPAEDAAPWAADRVDGDYTDGAADLEPSALGPLAASLGPALDGARTAGHELFGYAETEQTTTWLATSTGVRRRHTQPTASVHLNGKAQARTRSAWAGGAGRTLGDVDVRALADEVVQRLGWQARRVDVPAGRHDAVLTPAAVADLMAYAYFSADARSAHEGRSVFGSAGDGTRVGRRLTEVPLTLASDPSYPGLECPPFVATPASSDLASVFDNGLDVGAATWVDAGVLTALPTTRHTAQLAGLPFTPGADNLVLSGGDGAAGDVPDLVARLGDGLLVTCLWYIREVDPRTLLLTGLTRDGVYLVRGGEVVGATTNFRFNESPVGMLDRVTDVGASRPTLAREFGAYLPRTVMPPLTVRDFNFSSVSQAS